MISGYLNVLGTNSVGLQAQLKTGDTVVFRVRAHTAPDTWLVSMLGKQLTVRSEIPLSTGDVLKARAHFERGHLFLKLISHQQSSAAERFLQRQGLPAGPAYTRLTESLMQSGLPLREELFSYAVKAFFSSTRHNGKALSRFLAVLLDKGIKIAPEALDSLYEAVEGVEREDNSNQNGKHHQKQQGRGEGRKDDSQPSDRKDGQEPEDAEPINPKAEDIKAQCERTSQGDNGLQLWNHLAGRRDNWIVIPLAWVHRGQRIEGRLRIRVAGGRADRFTLTVYARERWHFSMDLRGDQRGEHRKLRLYTDSDRITEKGSQIIRVLRENLHNDGIEIDDTINREEEFDLFDPGSRQEMRGIDRLV